MSRLVRWRSIGCRAEVWWCHQLDDLGRHVIVCPDLMVLSYRKRGDVWHCRGSVRVGRQNIPVREFSTGCGTKSEAEAVGAAEEARIRRDFLDNGTVSDPSRRITIQDC